MGGGDAPPPAPPEGAADGAHPPPYPLGRLLALAGGLGGIQLAWAVQIGYVTKALLQLGMPPAAVSYAWLAGPIAGIVVQPLVGAASDRCASPYGRRRPFIVAGAAITAVCLLTFSHARELGIAAGDVATSDEGGVDGGGGAAAHHPRGLAIGVVTFWALDFAINGAMGPLRALLMDVVPPSQQGAGNAAFAFMTGLGNFGGNTLGSLRLGAVAPAAWALTDMQALYGLAAVVLIVTVAVCVVATPEVPLGEGGGGRRAAAVLPEVGGGGGGGRDGYAPLRSAPTAAADAAGGPSVAATAAAAGGLSGSAPPGGDAPASAPVAAGTWATLAAAARTAPFPFWRLFGVQCLTWTAWFALFIYATSWVGGDVVGGVAAAPPGTPLRAAYDRGVRWGNGGLAAQAVVSIAYAAALPALLRWGGAPAVYAGGHLVLGGALLGMMTLGAGASDRAAAVAAATAAAGGTAVAADSDSLTARAAGAVALLAATGIPWATTMTVPWALMGAAVARSAAAAGEPAEAGVYATLFNLSQCFPEVAVSLVSALLVRGGASQGQVLGAAGVVALGGAVAIIACPLVRRGRG